MLKGSDLFVAALENEGVDRIFGIPGEENLDIVESIRRSSIQLILTRHEQAAAFMAATYGRLTGKPGVCITTLGPGALNLTTGAAYAGFAETKFGRLAPGLRADFIIIDRDPLFASPAELRGTQILETWIGGERVWQRK